MKYFLQTLARVLSLPIYLLILIIGGIELISICFTVSILQCIYEFIFQIKYKNIRYNPPIAGSEILWNKLTNQINKL